MPFWKSQISLICFILQQKWASIQNGQANKNKMQHW